MPAKETHIATLQDARSSCYFCCDVHGEERRSRLTTFSGCDIVIASDSVAMIGSPGSVGLATMWLERRKLISLPVSRDWAANDRGGTPREGTATPPLPSPARRQHTCVPFYICKVHQNTKAILPTRASPPSGLRHAGSVFLPTA